MPKNNNQQSIYTIILIFCVIATATFRLWKPEFSTPSDNSHIEYKTILPCNDSIVAHSYKVDSILSVPRKRVDTANKKKASIGFRFSSSMDYHRGFPDLNDIQLLTASRLGIASCNDREEATERKDSLVFIGENPYYVVEELSHSIPYLVPRASRLLTEISRSFLDSLATRGLPPYKIVVTSVLRTTNDINKLKLVNVNASENSCHRHGTTFDICYNKFENVVSPKEKQVKKTWPIELKQILAEVLDDQRKKGTCYIKYEYRQACFHITAR